MNRLLPIVAILLVLTYGCTSSLGFVFEEDCEGMRDSEYMACLHQAAVTMANLAQESDEGALICNRIMDEVGAPHQGDDIGRRAETERNTCLYDVVKATAKFDEDANAWCTQIDQATYRDEFFGAAVTQEMCLEQYQKQRELAESMQDNQDSLCNMTFYFVMSVMLLSVFYRRKR